ncbi:unnamed protein product [Gongylonema pulchrum]|uniref:Uncharacterized protein n=1 Tax=Gongylonema pulchrum TaxID=637853 RepID=A0A3P7NB80_9BILA|nr:unnamed protein product [Gongylonema pulchrum]
MIDRKGNGDSSRRSASATEMGRNSVVTTSTYRKLGVAAAPVTAVERIAPTLRYIKKCCRDKVNSMRSAKQCQCIGKGVE